MVALCQFFINIIIIIIIIILIINITIIHFFFLLGHLAILFSSSPQPGGCWSSIGALLNLGAAGAV